MEQGDQLIRKDNIVVRLFKIKEIGALLPLIVLIIITSLINKSFYSLDNIVAMLRATSYIFIPAIGMTYILMSRNLDLSVGSQIALSSILIGTSLVHWGLPIWLSIIICIAGGALAGAFNGTWSQ